MTALEDLEALPHPSEHPSATRSVPAPSTWAPIDLGSVLDGTHRPPQPTIGQRTDGVGLLYPGRQHSVAGESESCKTWLMLHVAGTELDRGEAVVYVDFEDDESGIGGRLLALGANPDTIRDRFAYLRPEEPIGALGNPQTLQQVLGDLRPTLVVVDGVTEAMVMHDLNPLDNSDVAAFGRLLPRRLAQHGAAVVSLDHVTKASENRGRYAIGAAHKLNGLNGAAYVLENRTPFGTGLTGRSTVTLVKDRPGQLRQHTLPNSGGHWYADLVLTSEPGFIDAALHPPVHRDDVFIPTTLMAKVSDALTAAPGPLSFRDIKARVTGKDAALRTAIARLIDDGHITTSPGARGATLHTLAQPYGDPDD